MFSKYCGRLWLDRSNWEEYIGDEEWVTRRKRKVCGVQFDESRHIVKIILPNNRLEGPITCSQYDAVDIFQLLPHLKSLVLSDNSLSGFLSESLVNMKSLAILFLNNNRIAGALPGCHKVLLFICLILIILCVYYRSYR